MNTLLFVDDELGIRLTVPRILEENGFQVSVAESVSSALSVIKKQKFDILVTDLNINDPRDGFLVLKAARTANPGCIAVVLTGFADHRSREESLKCGADAYFVKPTANEELVRAIRKKLESKVS